MPPEKGAAGGIGYTFGQKGRQDDSHDIMSRFGELCTCDEHHASRSRGLSTTRWLRHWAGDRARSWLAEVNRLMDEEALQCVRQAVTRGVPMGNETWKARVARRLGLDVTLRPRGRPRKDTQKSSWQPLIAEDSALLKVFGQVGVGLFAAPTVIEKEVQCQYSVEVVGRLESVREQFYAISVEKKVKHPAVLAIAHEARQKLFG